MTSRHIILELLVLGLVSVFAAGASGAVISVSATAPTVDRFDIAQLGGAANPGGDEGHIWSDRPVQGQVFTTSTNRDGYLLRAITLKNLSTANTGGAFTVRIGAVSDNTFSLLTAETTASGTSYVAGDYLTVTFSTPIMLSANTVYGFDWGSSANGFVTANSSSDAYTGGMAYSSGDNSISDDANLVLRSFDRVFHLDITRPMPRPALEYFFDNVTGQTVRNSGYLGAAGNATLRTGTTVATGGQPFLKGQYLVVDQAGDQMVVPDIDALDQVDEFSLSFFIRPTASLVDWSDLMGDCDSAPTNDIRGWQLESFADGHLLLRLWNDALNDYTSFASSAGLLVAGQWQHIGITVSGVSQEGSHDVTVAFYKDGEFVTSLTRTGITSTMGNSAEGFKLGNVIWDKDTLAEYGGVAFFDTALTAEEMAAYYDYVLTPEPSALLLTTLALAGLAFWKAPLRWART